MTPDAKREYMARYRVENRDRLRDQSLAYYTANRERLIRDAMARQAADPERTAARKREWSKANRPVLNERKRARAPRLDRMARLWSKVDKGDGSGCWLWNGRNIRGYGAMEVGRKTIRVTRFLWAQLRGPIPTGMLVCHSCDTPACVRISPLRADGTPDPDDHLFMGSPAANTHDMLAKGRDRWSRVSL